MLRSCRLCEKRCGVDRAAGEPAPCGLGDQTWCFKRHVSYAEEIDLLPSYMVYLGGCNFRCRFCVQGPTCFAPRVGHRVQPTDAALDFERMVARGARTINLLGGEPSLHLHTILEIAAVAAEPLPLLINSNMYMTPEVIDLLEGVAGMYVADFKFGCDGCARDIAGIDRYMEVVTRNLLRASEQAPMIVRHLLMPGHLECCFKPVARWMAEHLTDVQFSLMTGYVPAWRACSDERLGRTLTTEECEEAEALVTTLGLRRSS
ncbi:MAG TPA: radical SAM protein [Phycisphaerales bacterium]|nr:radical SAM protein [Phycisphaerales bacterium]